MRNLIVMPLSGHRQEREFIARRNQQYWAVTFPLSLLMLLVGAVTQYGITWGLIHGLRWLVKP